MDIDGFDRSFSLVLHLGLSGLLLFNLRTVILIVLRSQFGGDLSVEGCEF